MTKHLRFVVPSVTDIPVLAELGRRTFSETFVGKAYYTQELIDGYARVAFDHDKLAGELIDPKIQFFLVEVNGEIGGYIKLAERDLIPCVKHLNAIYLDRFYLVSSFHRRGLGGKMLAKVFEIARDRGYDAVWLSVWENNEPALNFYRKNGFVRAGEWDWPFESLGQKYIDLDYIFTVNVPREPSF